MEKMWESFIGKKIFIKLKSGRNYEGNVEYISDNFIFITDKFGKKVGFSQEEINLMQEEK
jgi:small nuclear ribonucleoprotein (snRNP)-like protein